MIDGIEGHYWYMVISFPFHLIFQIASKKMDYLAFHLKLAKELIGARSYRQQNTGRPILGEIPERMQNTGEHFPEYTPRRVDCLVCNKVATTSGVEYDKGRTRVHTICNGPGCSGVGLCGPTANSNHFKDFHTKKNLLEISKIKH